MAGNASIPTCTRSREPSVSESASSILFCSWKALARAISSRPGVCLTIPFSLLFPFPFPFPSRSHALSPSHPLFPYLSRSQSHRHVCPPHPHHFHCHCHHQDGSFHCSVLWDPPSSQHHHRREISHPNSVGLRSGIHLAYTASSLAAESLPREHLYHPKRNAQRCVYPLASWLSADWSDQLDPRRHGGCPISHCSFGCRFCQTFAPYISGRLATTPEKVNYCSSGAATSAGIVKSVLYGGVCSSSPVCAGVCEGVSIVSCNETCRINIRSIDD
jgi:hypothetical protein